VLALIEFVNILVMATIPLHWPDPVVGCPFKMAKLLHGSCQPILWYNCSLFMCASCKLCVGGCVAKTN